MTGRSFLCSALGMGLRNREHRDMKRNRKTRSLLTIAVLLALGRMTSGPADAVVQ